MTGTLASALEAFQSPPGFAGHGFAILFEASFKGAVLLLFGLISCLVLRRASAAMRHLVWTLALHSMLLMPLVSLTVPTWRVAAIPASSTDIGSARDSASQSVPAVGRSHQAYLNHAAPLPASKAFKTVTRPSWFGWLLSLWTIGLIFLGARIAVGRLRIRRLARRAGLLDISYAKSILESVCLRLRIIRRLEVRISTEVAIPFTWGLFHPTVLLPAEARQWSRKHLEFALAHELAHVKRLDYLTQTTAQVACALFWFHPLVWLAASEIRKERERACDDIVLNLGHWATDYAEFLLVLTRSLRRPNHGLLTGVAMVQSSQLEVRMKALLDSGLNHRSLVASRALLVSALAMGLLLPVAAIRVAAKNSVGNISGTVHDPSGAVVPGADVILINVESGQKAVDRTRKDGTYEFPANPAGRYRLEITNPGFVRTKTADLELKPSSALHQDITLSLGEVTQMVTVSGHRPADISAAPTPAPQRIRVGGLVEAAHLTYQVKPDYPAIVQKEGVEGTVVLRAVIGTNGEILGLSPSSGPDPALIKAAMDAIRQWRYKPTLLNGVPVEVATTIEVTFQLDD